MLEVKNLLHRHLFRCDDRWGTETALLELVVLPKNLETVMNSQRSAVKAVAILIPGLVLAGFVPVSMALPVSLGAAGPGNWSVLEIGTGKIDMSNPAGFVEGNVGVYAGGKLHSSGPDIIGDLYLGTGSTAQFSGSANVTGSTFQNAAAQTLLNQARADALAAAAAAKSLIGSSVADITGSQTLSPGVYYLDKIDLGNNEVLTLNGSASDSFVFNIDKDFKLNSADIVLTGGLIEANVLFNYYGEHDVAFSGGGNAAELHGILLSSGRKVHLSPGLVVGEIISDMDISIVSGAQVQGAPPPTSLPDSASTLLLSCISIGILFGCAQGKRFVS
jgi:hypothetical protein